jgi:hypothetical protein
MHAQNLKVLMLLLENQYFMSSRIWGVRDLETGFGFMAVFIALIYNLLPHFTNHNVFSSPSSSTASFRVSLSSSRYTRSLGVAPTENTVS